jgi:hypothetical protein
MFVDFMFVDILFAPTMASPKREKISNAPSSSSSPEALKANPQSAPPLCEDIEQPQQRRKVEIPTSSPMGITTPVRSTTTTSQLNRVKRLTLNKIQTGNLDLETTRVLPSSTLKAHALAKMSVNDIIDDRVSVIKKTVLCHETQRRASLLRARSKAKLTKDRVINLNEMSVNEQFIDLSVDIAEQRKELRRSQQEKFDEMWG